MLRLLFLLGVAGTVLAQPAPTPKPGLPLKTERKLEFTTDEGTWLSVDVSRAGRN